MASFTDTSYIFVFKVNLSKKYLFYFLTKYIYFILPKIEAIETFKFKTNKNSCTFLAHGYMNYFESIGIFEFLGDSDLFLINHLNFEVNIITNTTEKLQNVNLLRSLQIPIL